MEVMGYQVHAIGKAIRPDQVTYTTFSLLYCMHELKWIPSC